MSSLSARRTLLLTVYPPDGGAARHVIDLARGLDPDRFTIDVACLPGSEPWTELGPLGNVTVHALQGSHGRPQVSDLRDLPLLVRLAGRADVIHAHSAKAGFLTRLAAAARRRTSRTLFTPHGWSFWSSSGIEGRSYAALERVAAHWCRLLIAVSEAEAAAGLGARVGSRDQYRVVPNGVDVGAFAAEPRPQPGRIVFVGRLRAPKRADLALEALREVQDIPEAMLDVVGDGPLRAGLERLAGSLGLRERVRFLGSRDDLPRILAEAACLLLASDYEGCPLAVLEAMAAGVPVVATSVGGVPELIVENETGLLAEAGDSGRLARALRDLLTSPERARRLGAAGRVRARTLFSREQMVARTCALYDEIAAGD